MASQLLSWWDMSKAEMKKGNMDGCMKFMKQAHTAMGL
jgi:hypothetical protein